MEPEFVRVAELPDIPKERGRRIEVEGRTIALFNVDGIIYAIDDCCPHQGGPLGDGLIQNGIVVCPWHLWQFDVRTGVMPCAPKRKIACYAVKVLGTEVHLDVSSLTAPLRSNKRILRRLAAGETMDALAQEYGVPPEEIETRARQIRIGERLVWMGERLQRQGNLYGQDFLELPYREQEGVSYEAQQKFEELIDLL
jgi:nitrite reductase/ring-hydroxylating ferredoxin subunit